MLICQVCEKPFSIRPMSPCACGRNVFPEEVFDAKTAREEDAAVEQMIAEDMTFEAFLGMPDYSHLIN